MDDAGNIAAPPHSPPPPPQLLDECLSYAPRIFVEDGCVGSSRASELRVRVVTDS